MPPRPASKPGLRPAGPSAALAVLTRADWCCFAAVAAFAFLIRLVYLLQIRDVVFFQYLIVDAEAYDEWATRIAAGDWIGDEVFYQAPLYPYFLAVCQRLVGHDLWNIRVIQIAIGAVSCGLMFLAARLWFAAPSPAASPGAADQPARGIGLLAGLILAVYGPAVFFDGLIQKAVLDALFGTLLLALLGAYAIRPTIWRLLGAGFTLGGFVLTRENAALAYVVIAAWLLVGFAAAHPVRRLGYVAVFTAAVAAPLLVVGARNYAVGGEFILTTSQLGPNLYIGNNAGATGVLSPLRAGRDGPRYERADATELAQTALGRELSPAEVSRYWVGRVIAYVAAQPGDWLALLGRKAALLVNTHEVADAEDIYYYEQHSGVLRGLLWLGHFGVLLPLAAAGIVLSAGQRRRLWVLYTLLATYAAGVLAFYVFGRYRYPLVPPLILFAAYALFHGAAALYGRRWRALGWPAAVGLLVAVAANWPLRSRHEYLATAHLNAAAALTEHGRGQEGLEQLATAQRLAPERADVYLNYGVCYGVLGRPEEAVAALRRAAELRPGDPQIESLLGVALAEAQDLPGATLHLMAAWRAWPHDEATARNLIAVLRMQERWSELSAVRKARYAAAPQDRMLAAELAWMLATCPDAAYRDGATAVRLASLALDAHNPQLLDVLAAALAEAGAYEEAVRTAERALALARESGASDLTAGVAARLALYRAGTPYRE